MAEKEEDQETSSMEDLKERVPDVQKAIDDAANQLSQFTAARETAVRSRLNDIALNLEDGADEIDELFERVKQGKIKSQTDLAFHILDVAEDHRAQVTSGAAVGAYIGSFAGPIGGILGALTGSSVVYLHSIRDDRSVIAIPLQTEQVPREADPASSTEPPLADCQLLQAVLDEALETEDSAEQSQRATRAIDFDDVVERLDQLEFVDPDGDEVYSGYYVEHEETTFTVLVDEGEE